MTLSCDYCALAGVCFPAHLSPSEIKLLEQKIEPGVRIEKNEALYEGGSPFTGLYAVKSGSFKSSLGTSDGFEQVLAFHMPGELVGFDGYNSIHDCTVTALESSTVCKIPQKNLDFLTTEVQGIANHVHSMVAQELKSMNSVKLLIAKKTAKDRVLCFLKFMSDRFVKRGFSGTEFALSMSRSDIADYLGMAPETLSRLFKRLSEDNIIKINRRNVKIIDMSVLDERTCVHHSN